MKDRPIDVFIQKKKKISHMLKENDPYSRPWHTYVKFENILMCLMQILKVKDIQSIIYISFMAYV